jgi:hypothetical protein
MSDVAILGQRWDLLIPDADGRMAKKRSVA